jgi:hypothetical protein
MLRRLKNSLRCALVVAILTSRQLRRMDLRLDPVQGEGHQPDAPLGVEPAHGLHEADIAFLDQVCLRQAVAQVIA